MPLWCCRNTSRDQALRPVEMRLPVKASLKAAKLRIHIRTWSCAGALCATTLSAAAAGESAPAPPAHPLVGTWSWSVFGGKCVETWQYRADGIMLGTSGEAVTEWTYVVSPQAGPDGFYKVGQNLMRENGKKDCSGDSAQEPGASATAYLQLNPARDRYISCKGESLAACFGPLRRVR
jgi:hypothetical protein